MNMTNHRMSLLIRGTGPAIGLFSFGSCLRAGFLMVLIALSSGLGPGMLAREDTPQVDATPEADPVQDAIDKAVEYEALKRSEHEKKFLQTFDLEENDRLAAQESLQNMWADEENKIEKSYWDIIRQYPDSSDAVVALGNYFNDRGMESKALEQWEKALVMAPQDPAIWNNIAGYHTHNGDINKAFEYFEKAVSLTPPHWVYFHNFGNVVFLFRKDSMDYYRLNEQEIFDKAFEIYARAQELAPANFDLARDIANSYYLVQPPRFAKAIASWQGVLNIASNDHERQDVLIHLARWELKADNPHKALEYIDQVTLLEHATLKKRVKKNILKALENIN